MQSDEHSLGRKGVNRATFRQRRTRPVKSKRGPRKDQSGNGVFLHLKFLCTFVHENRENGGSRRSGERDGYRKSPPFGGGDQADKPRVGCALARNSVRLHPWRASAPPKRWPIRKCFSAKAWPRRRATRSPPTLMPPRKSGRRSNPQKYPGMRWRWIRRLRAWRDCGAR